MVNEQLLIARLRARDDGAVEDLAREYSPRVYQLALRYLKNPQDAEEATQDVLLKAYQKIANFRGDAALSSWLFRIAFNTAMSKRRGVRQFDALDAAAQDKPDPAILADERISRRQLRKRLARAVRELPTIYRGPLVLRDIEGLSTQEASDALRVNDQTLKSRLHRARLLLRQRLQGGLEPHLIARG